jgi:hypothetical protein
MSSYPYQVTFRKLIDIGGSVIVPCSYGTTIDAVEIHADSLKARLEDPESPVIDFKIVEVATGVVVRKGSNLYKGLE